MERRDAPIKQLRFLALGDSYTIGEAVHPEERWPAQLVRELRKKNIPYADPDIIAVTGWRTDELKQALAEQQPSPCYDMVSLLIGVNNLYQGKPVEQYAVEFEELLKTAIELAKSNIQNAFVLSIPDYGFTPFGKDKQSEISRLTDAFNEVNQRIALRYNIAYFDVTGVSRRGLQNPELVASDHLHPSGVMYSEWVRIILTSPHSPCGKYFLTTGPPGTPE